MARSIYINTDRKQLKQVLHFWFSFEPRFSEVDKSLFQSFSLRPSVLRHVMYTIVDRYYMTMKERLGASLGRGWLYEGRGAAIQSMISANRGLNLTHSFGLLISVRLRISKL